MQSGITLMPKPSLRLEQNPLMVSLSNHEPRPSFDKLRMSGIERA